MECKSCLPRPFSFGSLRYLQYRVGMTFFLIDLFVQRRYIGLFIRNNTGLVTNEFHDNQKWNGKNCGKLTYADISRFILCEVVDKCRIQ